MSSFDNQSVEELEALLTAKRQEKEQIEQQANDDEAEQLEEALTETGNAEKFISILDGNARYIQELKKWCYWGKEKWNLNDDGEMIRRFKEVVDSLKDDLMKLDAKRIEYKLAGNEAAEKAVGFQIKSMKSWIRHSRNKLTITNSIALASNEKGISVKYNLFDSKGHFFGVENGVVDLRDGKLISGEPEYMMLKSSMINYDPNAECPEWNKFLNEVMEGDYDKVELLQQIAGSALIGKIKERMFVLNGGGSNGKTTFVTMLSHILGVVDDDGYKVTVTPDVITGTGGNGAEYALAKIKGARLLVMNETGGSGKRSNILDDTIVKRLVDSDDGFQARQIRGVPFEFPCFATITLLTNNLPKVITTDNGIWRRLVLVNFKREFSDEEKVQNLVEGQLKPESAGILKWCVDGAVKYLANKEKFVIPKVVVDETAHWRGLEDKLGTFMLETVVPNSEGTIKLTELLKEYKVYCDRNGSFAGGERELKKQLEARKFDVDNATSGGVARLKGWCFIDEQYDGEENVESIKSSRSKKSELDTLKEFPQARYNGSGS